ncbi:TPA: coiled-coil domain-containing protein [Vibrio alginolyticus]
MTSSWYRRGTVTVTDGSKEVVGVGTLWVDAGNKPLAGDIMFIAGSIYEIESITDNEHLSLFRPFTGVPPANGEYAIIRNTSVTIATRVAAMVAAAINSKQVLLDDLRGYYTSTADKVLIHTGDGSTIEVVPLQTLVSDITKLIDQAKSIKDDLVSTDAALSLIRKYSNTVQGVEVEPGMYSAKSYALDASDTLALVNQAKSDVDLTASQVQKTKADIEQFVSTSKTEIDAKATAVKEDISELVAGGTDSITSHTDTSKGAINTLLSASKTEITDLVTTEKAAISQQSSTTISEMTALKQSAEQAASTATQKVTQAAASATSAAQSKTDSQALKTQTEALANETKQVAEEIKSGSYVGWQIYCQSEANMKAARMLASEQFAASGFVHYGKHALSGNSVFPVNESLYAYINAANTNTLRMGRTPTANTYEGTSKTLYPVTSIAGFISELIGNNTNNDPTAGNFIKFPEAPDGAVTYNKSSGEIKKHSNPDAAFTYANTSADIEVVINRVDLFGGEFFLEEVSQSNPFVYPKGMIQSQATSMNGVATTMSNRPVTYYAAYGGDTGSRGRGVDFWSATDEQKKAMVSDESNNIFMLDDGRVVQWRMRQRTIAGAGNGDWLNTNSVCENSTKGFYLQYSSGSKFVAPQGALDTVREFNTGNPTYRGSGGSVTTGQNPNQKLGVFSLFDNAVVEDIAIDDECYFHVWGVVPRLNQGAYHPSFNPLGTKSWVQSGKGWNAQWWQVSGVSSTRQCFDYKTASSDLTQAGANEEFSGFIGSRDGSSRPDGRFYDVIYASGLGGVIDYRFSAWDMGSKDEAAKIFQKLIEGTYRGKEHLPRMRSFVPQYTVSAAHGTYLRIEANKLLGDTDWIPTTSSIAQGVQCSGSLIVNGVVRKVKKIYRNTNLDYYLEMEDRLGNAVGDVICGVIGDYAPFEISGNFNMIDVLGSPERILAKTELANGWLGDWIPVVPNNTLVANKFPMTHVAVDKDMRMYWSDGDAAWQTGTYTFAPSLNARDNSSAIPSTRVALHSYIASAKLTKSANIKPILNGANGVGDVYATMFNDRTRGGLLRESFINKVVSGYSQKHPHSQTVKLNKCTLLDGYFVSNPDFSPTHECIALGEPAYDDSAIKVLWSQSSNNQQVNLNLSFNELIWVGSYSSLNVTKITSTNTATDGVAGQLYLTDPSITNALGNKLLRCVKSFTASWGDVWLENGKGFVYITAPTGDPFLVVYGSQADLWGDDGKLRIVSDAGTYKNLNGDLCLYGTHELAIPYGYTKNKAHAGSQVNGVDL